MTGQFDLSYIGLENEYMKPLYQQIEEIAPECREAFLWDKIRKLPVGEDLLDGLHPYSWACHLQSLRLARLIWKEREVDVNLREEDGSTPLAYAPNYEFARFFVNLGAKVSEERPKGGKTSLHRAASLGRTDHLRLLLEEADGLSCLENFDETGRTALGYAAFGGHLDAVKLLLSYGADANAYDCEALDEYSLLQRTIEKGYEEISLLLIEKGADPHCQPGLSRSPYQLATEQRLSKLLADVYGSLE